MKSVDPHLLLDRALANKRRSDVVAALETLLNEPSSEPRVLTIIANAGVHEIPKAYLRGEVFEASRGDWNCSTTEALVGELNSILIRLARKLRAERWERVYIIPTGHPILSMQIKNMVYRILRLNSVDLYYKSGLYFEVDIDQRAVAIEAGRDE